MDERGNPVDIAALMLFGGELPEGRLREVITTKLLAHRRFAQRVIESPLGVGPPHWKDEPGFSLDHHLERLRLPQPAGIAELRALIGNLLSKPMDLEHSPWRVYLVDGLPGGTALVTRIHHCMGDGFALMQILLSIADAGPEAAPPSGSDAPLPAPSPPSRLSDLAHLAGDDLRSLGHLLLLPFDLPCSLRGSLSGERRVTWTPAIPLSRVKAIGRPRGATVNDVLMTAVSGALRRYLGGRGDPVDELSLRAVVPVNLRPSSEPLDLEHGNWFGLVFVDLPVHLADSNEREKALRATIARIKASQEAIVSLGVMAAMGRSPAVVEHVLEGVFARKGSLVVTNVPGPRAPLQVAGAPLTDIMFWAPHSGGLALGISILSYAGNLRIGIRSDAAVIADPDVIASYLLEELDILQSRG